jgi:hypothetical protein
LKRKEKKRKEKKRKEKKRKEKKRKEKKRKEKKKRKLNKNYLGREENGKFKRVPIVCNERIKAAHLGQRIHVVSLVIFVCPVTCYIKCERGRERGEVERGRGRGR